MGDNTFTREERRSVAEFVNNLIAASRPLTYHKRPGFQHSVEQVQLSPNFYDDEQYTMEQLSDELSVLARQKENTEREKLELIRRIEQSEIHKDSLRRDIKQIETERDRAIKNTQEVGDHKVEPMKIEHPRVKEDRVRMEMQLVETTVELAESKGDKLELTNENTKLKRQLQELEEVLGQTHEAIKKEKEKYSKTIGEIKRKLASEQAAIEDLTLEIRRAVAEKDEFQKEFLGGNMRAQPNITPAKYPSRVSPQKSRAPQKRLGVINGTRSIKTMHNIAVHAESFMKRVPWKNVKNDGVEIVLPVVEPPDAIEKNIIPDDVLV